LVYSVRPDSYGAERAESAASVRSLGGIRRPVRPAV
jgi:hypothetical protein